MKPRIEIEYRARFNRQEYLRLRKSLRRQARWLGPDDKEVWFYVAPSMLYKVVRNISTKTAKIVLKKNRIERTSSFDETEISIHPQDIDRAKTLISSISHTKIYHEIIKRENYLWHGVEIALKYSQAWGYHAELEIVITSKQKQTAAEKKIRQVADLLGVKLMTTNDIAKFLRTAHNKTK